MDNIYEIIICILAGLGAGVGTGFAGMSASAVITPMLVGFLNMEPYSAVGIALMSDVLASGASSCTYAKNKNIDIKHGLLMMSMVLIFTVLGSLAGRFLPDIVLGGSSILTALFMGVKFLVRPLGNSDSIGKPSGRRLKLKSVIGGIVVGFICGLMGGGGGMTMLFVLTVFLGYELKTAVGTSVFIMTFTALTGGVSHFIIGGVPDIKCLIICVISTLVFAQISAKIANRMKHKTLNTVVGIILLILGVTILFLEIVERM